MSTFPRIKLAIADLSPAVAIYIATVSAIASATAILLILVGVGVGSWAGVIALAAVAAFSERGRIELKGNLDVSISLLPATFAAVLYGPLAAMLVFGASVIGLSLPLAGRVAYLSSRALTGAAAAGAAAGVAYGMSGGTGAVVAAAAAASLVAEALDALFASVTFVLRKLGS